MTYHHTVAWCKGHEKLTNDCPINPNHTMKTIEEVTQELARMIESLETDWSDGCYVSVKDTEKITNWLTQTLKARDEELLAELESLKFTTSEIERVGEHYWDGDYSPSYMEVMKLTGYFNEVLAKKINIPSLISSKRMK